MIQLSRTATTWSGGAEDIRCWRDRFEHDHYVQLPQLLEARLLEFIQQRCAQARFDTRLHDDIGVELSTEDKQALSLLHLIINDPKFFRWIEQVTGCCAIGCFTGRVYRMVPDAGHYDRWHSDMVAHRMIALSINIGSTPYKGGIFQLRKTGSTENLCEIANTGPGDAILFRIDAGLEHRVTIVEGSVPKTAFAGWFQSEPDFSSLFR